MQINEKYLTMVQVFEKNMIKRREIRHLARPFCIFGGDIEGAGKDEMELATNHQGFPQTDVLLSVDCGEKSSAGL